MAWSPHATILLAAHGDNSMKGFWVPHKRAKRRKDFLLRRQCPEISSLVLSMLFPFQICRNMTFFEVFSEQYHRQLKEKKKKSKLFLPMPSTSVPFTELCRSSDEGCSFPHHVEARLCAHLSLCPVSRYRWVDRAACLSSQHFFSQS